LGGQRPLVPLLLLGPPFFSNYSFWVHHLVNWDDRHLLAHAMASAFSAAWQCLSKRTIGICVQNLVGGELWHLVRVNTNRIYRKRWRWLRSSDRRTSSQRALPSSPGIDFAEIHFGRKIFEKKLHPRILDKFPPENNRYKLIRGQFCISVFAPTEKVRSYG
jgi:hypothetical protein